MKSRTLAIDLAKDVFEIAVSDAPGRIREQQRLSRRRFPHFLAEQPPALVLMEACGSAHHWGRLAQQAGHRVRLLPAQYVRPYRRRNKTDRADTEALLEAHRCQGIHSVPVRSVEQQQVQLLHRVREQWKKTRTMRINGLRGALREMGLPLPQGASAGQRRAREYLDDAALPPALAQTCRRILEEITTLEGHIREVEQQLTALARTQPDVQRLQQIPGIGLLTSTALVAAAGSPHHFKSGRHFSAWLGITPREFSSGNSRYIGRISKQGDKYLRTLIIHGARSVLARGRQLRKTGKPLNHLQRWALNLEQRAGHNKATVALANKLARICWALWKHDTDFQPRFA